MSGNSLQQRLEGLQSYSEASGALTCILADTRSLKLQHVILADNGLPR